MENHRKKRKHERVDTLLEATFSDAERMYIDNILNLSLGGACVECHKPLEKAESITIIIPTYPPVKINARVRWCVKNGLKYKIGLEFSEVKPDQKRALLEFMRTFFWDRIN